MDLDFVLSRRESHNSMEGEEEFQAPEPLKKQKHPHWIQEVKSIHSKFQIAREAEKEPTSFECADPILGIVKRIMYAEGDEPSSKNDSAIAMKEFLERV